MIRKYPAVFLVPFIIVGIIGADLCRWPSEWFLLASLVLCLVALAVMRSHRTAATILFGLLLTCFSAFHYGIRYYDTGPTHLANHFQDGNRYRIYGQVSDWPDLKSFGTEIKIAVDSIEQDRMQVVHGSMMLKVSDSSTSLAWGDRIEFQGRIYSLKGGESPTGFDYRRYLNLRGVSALVYLPNLNNVRVDTRGRPWLLSWVDALRLEILSSFQDNLEPSPSALAAGFLIGETRNIPPEVYQRFRDSGTLHLLAVSGSNVALVVAFMMLVLRPFGLSRRRRAIVLLAFVLMFAALSYGEPSVIRASIMAALVITAALVQRRYDLNNLIAVAAMAILLYDPAQFFNVGFQLSFVVAWGLIFIMPRLHERFTGFHGRGWYRWLVFPVLLALTAQLCAAPLTAFYFHRVPLISPIANLVIVPLVSLAVVGSLCLLLADLILPLLGAFVGSLLNLLLILILKLLAVFGGEQSQVWEVSEPSWLLAVAVYFALVLGAMALTKRSARRWLLIGLLLLANVGLVAQIDPTPKGGSLELFTVPGGVAALYRQVGNQNGDLVITGLRRKPYPIDAKVLAPALTAMD
ncbi:MAG: ComEC family competence protein, partial [candidate division Zixibacteria bacterium]|nr:ComEC family competence protein [candidate division Zixibacteria bacterium]